MNKETLPHKKVNKNKAKALKQSNLIIENDNIFSQDDFI